MHPFQKNLIRHRNQINADIEQTSGQGRIRKKSRYPRVTDRIRISFQNEKPATLQKLDGLLTYQLGYCGGFLISLLDRSDPAKTVSLCFLRKAKGFDHLIKRVRIFINGKEKSSLNGQGLLFDLPHLLLAFFIPL